MDIQIVSEHNEGNVAKFFTYNGRPWLLILVLLCTGFGIILIPFIWNWGKSTLSETDMDNLWREIGASREDEAYRVANYDKDDALRDAIFFFAYADETAPGKEYRYKLGLDKRIRRNHVKLVYMIFGRDQLIVFDENICCENLWDGRDSVSEYYWKDVSSVNFDERENTFEIAVGPKRVEYPLTGQTKEGEGDYEISGSDRAQEVANAIRLILREKKA